MAYTVPTVNDGTDEPNGSVTVTVETGTGYTVGSPAAGTVTVNDNDTSAPPPPARPSFSRAAVSGTALTIAFSRTLDAGSAPAGSAFTVTATPPGGSARTIAGTGTASISGSTVTVTLASAVASGETVRVAYARPSANPLRGSNGQEVSNFTGRTVANNTPTTPSAPPPEGGRVSEGGAKVTLNFADELDAASTPDPADFTVTVAAASDAGSTSPTADDHYRVTAVSIVGATVELTISPQIPAGREATVSYTPGTRPLRTAAGAPVPTFSLDVAVPPAPTEPTVTVEGGSALEGERVTFTVRLSAAVDADVVLGWATGRDDSPDAQRAAADLDYISVSDGRVTIPAGSTEATFSVATAADDEGEGDETFIVTITAVDLPQGVVIVTASAVGTIEDDTPPEPPVTPVRDSISVEDGSAKEGSPVPFTVRLSSAVRTDVVLRWFTSPDWASSARATAGTDYTGVSDGRVRIPAGSTEATFAVETVADTVEEADETFRVNITEIELPPDAGIVRGTAVGTIENYLAPPPNEPPAFEPSEYAFELRENVDGSAEPVALGAVAAADPDGDEVSYALASGDATRFAVGSADGAVTYVGPGEDFETEPNVYELTVSASDPDGAAAEAPVTVTVLNENELPEAADDAAATDEDMAVTVDVLANDTDVDGDSLSVASVSAPENGTAEVTSGGAVLYTPAANWHGTDAFTYEIEDGNGGTASAAVEVTVAPVNDLPEAAGDSASTVEDSALVVDVLANDTDIDGDSLRVASVSAPANGTAAIAAGGGGVRYTPAENWHGTDAFTYEIDDGNGGMASATVTVTVAPVNDLPEAADDEASTNEDEAVTVDVLANDTDPDGDGLRIASVSSPENGTARIAAGVVLYMPAANFHGTDRFTYTVEDGNGGTASASVTVTVTPANDGPMAVGTIPPQTLEEGGEPARVELGPFFEDPDGDALTYGAASSDSSVVRVSVSGSVLTLVPVGYGTVVVAVAAWDAGGLAAQQPVAIRVSDGAARGMVSHALAGMARSHLASARMTLGRRPMASRSDASRLSLMGRDVPLSLNEAKSAAEQRWQGWLSGITSRAMSYARVDSAGGSGSGGGDDPTLGDLFRFGDLVGDLTRFEGGRDPLRGSEFQFGFDVGGGAQEAGGGGGLRLQLWGQGDVQTFRGAPSDGDSYDGELKTGYVGLDTWLGSRFMLGVAVARSEGTGDWSTGATSGALQTRLVAVHPYLQWNSGATSIWAMGGVGQGDADNVRHGNGLAETSDLGLRMGLVELRRRLAAGGGFSLALRTDAAWAELQTDTGTESLDGQTAAVNQLRFGAELSQQIRLGGLTLNPFGEAHVRRDGGAGQPGTGLELVGGLKAQAGFLRLDAQGRMLAVHSASGYEEQGFSATLSLGSQGGTGPSLSVSPRWGDLAAGGGDALWQDQVYSRYAAAPGTAPAAHGAALAPSARDPWAVDIRGGYGIRIPGNHLLTWSGSVNHSPMGPRFTTALQLGFGGSPRPRKETPPVP